MKRKRIVFAGGIFRDLIAYTPRFPDRGETIIGTEFSTGFGGKSANQSVMCRRLGAEVSFIGKVGDDENGRAYIRHFKDLGISVENLRISETKPTGVALIYVESPSGENKIVVVPGANEELSEVDVEKNIDLNPEETALVVCGLEMKFETSLAILKKARENGIKTVLNAAPITPAMNPEKILEFTDVLIVNENELEILRDRMIMDKILEKCRMVVLTLGKKGAKFVTKNSSKVVEIPEKVITVVDTTGAGDAFVGAFAFFSTEFDFLPTEEMIKRCCIIASFTVQKRGTQSSYPDKAELPEYLFRVPT